ncbi:MAG: S46 family peptidase [Flavobacteriales bacterium]|nr:S46 family peptidase [Flavobacteriales bacterium]
MKKFISLVIAITMLLPLGVKADEGMWLPMFIKRLNYVDMQKEGLKLTPEEIYSINNASLKDAIVNFGGFCTGEVISDQGLILTNHHCGYGAIAEFSNEEHDYLTDGFWAFDKSQELKPKSLFVSFLVKMEDVTDQIQEQLSPNMNEEERAAKVKELKASIAKQKTEGTSYRGVIKDFYKGNEFYLFIYNDYTDVRLVGAPPSSIGKYGGDTDNWMWPRHTGDFSMFRVYADADGNPSEYSENNVPLKPKHHLSINLNDKKEGDFAMIMGYPGSTERYLPSWGVQQAIDVEYPAVVKILDAKLSIMREYMSTSDKVRIDYATSYARFANYWKNRIGMIQALKKLNTVDKKKSIEKDFEAWVNADGERKSKYGQTLTLFEEFFSKTDDYTKSYMTLNLGVIRGSDVSGFVLRMKSMLIKYSEADDSKRAELKAHIEEKSSNFYEKHQMQMEREIMTAQLNIYASDASSDYQPEFFKEQAKDNNGDFKKDVDNMFDKSIYTNQEKLAKFLKKPKMKYIEKDELGILISGLSDYAKEIKAQVKPLSYNEVEAYRQFVAALREMNPDKAYAPDANFTMRLTYGQILPYQARDAVKYKFTTTIEGVMQKMDNSNPEFVVPEKLVELYNDKDYGQYANSKGELVVGFLSNNDITGGNSGSPVIDGNGNLIGTAFDGNWEAMSGDIEFEENLQRTISVDIRYTLFIVEKFAGAKNLIDEMTIIKD